VRLCAALPRPDVLARGSSARRIGDEAGFNLVLVTRIPQVVLRPCHAVRVEDYGAVEAAGTPGYHSARIGLRAPRVAVRVEVSAHWQSLLALALSAASNIWGGYGFIYIPHRAGKIHPALARALRAYDPDYLVNLGFTYGDLEAMAPGWIGDNIGNVPTEKDGYAAFLERISNDEAVAIYDDDGPGSELCSPYREHHRHLKMHMLSERQTHPLLKWSEFVGTRPAFVVPDGLDSLLTLALGKRAGFTSKPTLPLGAEADGCDDRLPSDYVRYALSLSKPRRAGAATGELAGLSTAWDFSQTGLMHVMRARPDTRPTAVIGSTAEDFALATALDRMFGSAIWIPAEWGHDEQLRSYVYLAFGSLSSDSWNSGDRPIVTSVSLSPSELQAVVSARWPEKPLMWDENKQPIAVSDNSPELLPAESLDLHFPLHLACGPGDYDRSLTLPTRADGNGGFEFVFPLPAETPSHEDLRRPQRPFWEVDVDIDRVAIPPGRNLTGASMLADAERDPATVLRSGRDGISFNPSSMFLVRTGATLTQSIAKPRLHALGLREWIARLCEQHEPDMAITLSQAGRRAMILTRLWGSRSAVARDLFALDDFLREFKPMGLSDNDAYEEGDGVRLTPTEGYLTLRAAGRTLPGLAPTEVRTRLNDLLRTNVLQRGLIVPCSECERRAFYRIELVGESNRCARCGASAYVTVARRSVQDGEPEWYYDLHGAVRELLEQNGDIPFLAGRALAAGARAFDEVAELDFLRPGEEPDEIDVVALVDGTLVLGEAKCVSHLGTRRAVNKSIAKLIRISDLLGADEILLATTAPGPWKATDTELLTQAIAMHEWRFGLQPRIRVVTDLRSKQPQNVLVQQP
jgi:hypothetical protein